MKILKILAAAFITHLLFPIFTVLFFYFCGLNFGRSLKYAYEISLVLILLGVFIFSIFFMLKSLLTDLWIWATR